jgi:hypothetical protein
MSIELKIKAKTLAAESKYIRHEEIAELKRRRLKHDPERSTYWRFHNHRIDVVRREARATHLARAFLKGKFTYPQVESVCRTDPDWDRVMNMIKRYAPPNSDPKDIADNFERWREPTVDSSA